MRAHDTDPEADRVQWEIYARMSGSERLELALEMSVAMREITADGIRHRHPEYDETQVRHALNRMMLGDSLFRAAWPNAPLLES